MSWLRVGLVAGAAAVLVLAATTGTPLDLRGLAIAGIAGLLVIGQRLREPGTTALGLLGLVTAVATGPATAAAAPALVAWAVPTWVVVLAAADGLGPVWPAARDIRARLGVHTAALASCLAAIPLAVLITGGARPAAGWAVGAALALLATSVLAAARRRS